MRKICVPSARIAASGVNSPIINGAAKNNRIPLPVITAIPRPVVSQPSRLVKSFLPAPMLCPINVVAAVPIPYPGM